MLLLVDIYHRKAVICRVSNGNALYSDIHCMPDVDRSVGPELFVVNWRIGIIWMRQKVPRKSPMAKNPSGTLELYRAKAETNLYLML